LNYRDLIRNWHAKASEEDFFSKFVFEYMAFIAYLRTQKYTGLDNDRRAIQRLKQDSHIEQTYLNEISCNSELKRSWKSIKAKLDARPLGSVSIDTNEVQEIEYWNCSHDRKSQKTNEERAKRTGAIHTLEDWENMVEFWCSIRNNLFHGTKDPEGKRDKFLVEHGYKTLRQLMEILLNEQA